MGDLIVVSVFALALLIQSIAMIRLESRIEDQEDRITRLATYVFERDAKKKGN